MTRRVFEGFSSCGEKCDGMSSTHAEVTGKQKKKKEGKFQPAEFVNNLFGSVLDIFHSEENLREGTRSRDLKKEWDDM